MPRDIPKDMRFRVLKVLETHPDITQREISERLGVSLGGVNYCLRALIDKGLVKAENFRASNKKMRYAYVLTPRGLAEKSALTAGFLRRKMTEYEALKAEIEALQSELDATAPDGARRWMDAGD